MRLETEDDRRATPRRATWVVVLLLVAGAPAMPGASETFPESGGIDASPVERIVSGFESLWHSLIDAWHGIGGTATAEAEDGSDPDPSKTFDPCDPACTGRNVDLDPDG